mmetsp:Transcript_121891/g.191293  ORF Transcript_121891/g.191293 Transcript_121891/m.191293 type:complete len:156 (-) Transcript_121891:30-497(-)
MSGTGVWASLREKFRNQERCEEPSCADRSGVSVDDDTVEPPDRAEIGRAAWRYLHSMAAHHPERASLAQQQDAQSWISSFVQLYPCSHCAEHFVEVCDSMPPLADTRHNYSMWWCRAHNRVNEELGKEPISCDAGRLIAAGRLGLGVGEEQLVDS